MGQYPFAVSELTNHEIYTWKHASEVLGYESNGGKDSGRHEDEEDTEAVPEPVGEETADTGKTEQQEENTESENKNVAVAAAPVVEEAEEEVEEEEEEEEDGEEVAAAGLGALFG